jgi:hypothetical protein
MRKIELFSQKIKNCGQIFYYLVKYFQVFSAEIPVKKKLTKICEMKCGTFYFIN